MIAEQTWQGEKDGVVSGDGLDEFSVLDWQDCAEISFVGTKEYEPVAGNIENEYVLDGNEQRKVVDVDDEHYSC